MKTRWRKPGKMFPLLCVLMLMLTSLSGCVVNQESEQTQPDSETADGETISIAATSVAICEILDSLGYDNVVGVPESEKTIPERYADATLIGAPMTPDMEIIKSLSPDLVLSPKTLESSLSTEYSAAGVSSAFLDLASVEGMYAAILQQVEETLVQT